MLDHHLGGRDISEVLAMSVTEAEEFFGAGEARTPAAHAVLAMGRFPLAFAPILFHALPETCFVRKGA